MLRLFRKAGAKVLLFSRSAKHLPVFFAFGSFLPALSPRFCPHAALLALKIAIKRKKGALPAIYCLPLHQPNGEKAPSARRHNIYKQYPTMRKYDKHAHSGNNETVSPFQEACRLMHQTANICHNWLNVTSTQATQLLQTEGGHLRSLRLAVLKPVTHEVTAKSLLQLVVLPARFDDPNRHGHECQYWQLLVYSWLPREQTERLREHLFSKQALKDCSFFLVHKDGCEKVFSNVKTI